MKRTNPLSLLLPSNHGYFLRDFAYDIGCTASIILVELIELDDYFQDSYSSHPKYGDGWFYATEDKIERRTGIRRKQQESDLKTLRDLQFIEMQVFGLPASRYFRINKQKIMEYFGIKQNLLECTKVQSSKNNCKTSAQTNNQIIEKDDEKASNKHSRMDNCTNLQGQLSILGPYNIIHKDPEYDTKETHAPQDAAPNWQPFFDQNPPPKKPEMLHPKSNVSISQDEHDALVSKFGADLVKAGYEDLSEWKQSADPKVVAKHKSDYRRLRKWVIPNLVEETQKNERLKQQAIAPHRRGSKMVTSGDYDDPSKFKIKRF